MIALDLFAGPGGWDHGIEPLGVRPLGIEWDSSACETRAARGLLTLQADVADLDPDDFAADLLIASPPCQAFSAAGKGDGQRDVQAIMATARALGDGRDIRSEVQVLDPRSLLVVEPLRWALALEPTYIACEQVPPVLMLWQAFADILRGHGYSCWAGLLSAEAYGVPQTRERAFLMASRASIVLPPEPTHQTYAFGEPAAEQHTLGGTLAPWVSMAEALGWDEGSAEYRLARGEGMLERHGERPNTPDHRPAPVMTSKARTATWIVRTGQYSRKTRQGPQELFERDIEAPAPTVTGTTDRWKVGESPTHYDQRQTGARPRPIDAPARTMLAEGLKKGVPVWTNDRPAPTVVTTRRSKDGLLIGRQMADGEGENVGGWGYERPSTTIAGDSRVFQPGGHHEPGKQSQNAVRVTEAEAAILQGFPPDYPWQGSRTKRFEQIGNAVPPPLARAVVASLLNVDADEAAA